MAKPNDIAAAIIGSGGALTVIDGRGNAYVYNAGKDENGPQSFSGSFIRGEAMVVIDSSDVPWSYNTATGLWSEGIALEVKEGQEDEVWQEAGNVTDRKPPEEPEQADERGLPAKVTKSKAKVTEEA